MKRLMSRFGASQGKRSHQYVNLSMSGKPHPSALYTHHKFLDDGLRCPAAVDAADRYAPAVIFLIWRNGILL